MGNAGSMDSQQTDFRAHNMPLKLPMPEPGELEERFAVVLILSEMCKKQHCLNMTVANLIIVRDGEYFPPVEHISQAML
ncbi:clavesin-2 [Platysternon megacephalum]|uniref:Clavesin-2 n=1 Tax=Platysternon megacephalum TaxID=55544 RepID=A0A4D9F9R1_9SAUR|nr:clavesin-2 [Platysternon megacephalum]